MVAEAREAKQRHYDYGSIHRDPLTEEQGQEFLAAGAPVRSFVRTIIRLRERSIEKSGRALRSGGFSCMFPVSQKAAIDMPSRYISGRIILLIGFFIFGASTFAQTTLTPATLTFGNDIKGVASAPKTATLKNTQTAVLTIIGITISGGNAAADYTMGGTCAGMGTLAAGRSCSIIVTFTPSALGSRTATLTVTHSASTSPQSVSLTGTGIAQVTLSASSLSFATTAVGNTSSSLSVTLTNQQKTMLTSLSVSPSGDFSIASNTCGTSVPPEGTCKVSATFSPTETGARSGALTFTDSAANSPQMVSLVGTGSSPVTISPATLTFGSTTVGNTSIAKTVTLTNHLTTPLNVMSVVPSGDFAVATNTCTSAVGAACTIGVVFEPTENGARSGSLTINYGAFGSPSVTSLTGTGNVTGLTSISISPASASVMVPNTQRFVATGNFKNGTHENLTGSVTWSSKLPSVATIGATGLAQSVSQGSTTIMAMLGTLQASAMMTVTPAPVVLQSISVAPAGVSLGLNYTQQFTATGTFSDGSTQDITNTATWSSFNPLVVTVGTSGVPASTPGLATVVSDPATAVAVAVTASSGNVGPFGGTNTAFVSTIPGVFTCPTKTVDMQLLVVNNSQAAYADFPAIQQILNYVGTPYTVVDASSGALPPLSDGMCHGYFQGVIYAFGDDIYTFPYSVASQLASYESFFGVRQLNWYTNPTPDFGLNYYTGTVSSTTPYSGNFTPAAVPVFFYANTSTPVTITNAFIYLTTPVSAPNISSVTPLLVDSSGNTLSAITQFSDGRQYLSQMFDSNQYLTHDLVLAYGLLNWVTQGVFLGDYHVYASAQVDDFFIDDSEWIPGTPCTNPITHDRTPPDSYTLPVFRIDATNDMSAVVGWQNGVQADPLLSNFELTLAFNGVGTTGDNGWTGLPSPGVSNDDLVSNVQNYQGSFHWISHTFDHPTTLNGLCQSTPSGTGCGDMIDIPPTDDIDLEVLTNLFVANGTGVNLDTDDTDVVTPIYLTDFNPANMVTPGVTGLNDPNVPGYLYVDGIRNVVTDTSVTGQPNNGANPSPNVGIVNSYQPGLYEVPRHPNDIFYNAANWADDQAEFSCIYNNPVVNPYNTYNASQILDFVSSSFVTNMLMGDMDPEMFHQPDLHFSDNSVSLGLQPPHVSSLLSDTYDQTFQKYEALYNLPVLSPTLDQAATLMQNRNSFNLSGVTASIIGFGSANPQITITVPPTSPVSSATIPVTGMKSTGSEIYGGQNISYISMTPGMTTTLPLQ